MAQDRLDSQRTGTQIVHVRENSDSEMNALFEVAMNPQQDNKTGIPLRMRNLPASFFKQPEPHMHFQHSKDGSNDSTGFPGQSIPQGPPMPIAHMRAHSSPASLQQTLSTVPSPPHVQHQRQHSCDLLDEQQLPAGWEMAKTPTGQRYFLNHITQTTTWIDPRKSFNISQMNSQQSPPQSQQSPNVSMQNLGPLPPGWEQATTETGEVYYINHMDKSTSWFDPRLPAHMQRLQMQPRPLPQQQQQQVTQSSQHQQVHGQNSPVMAGVQGQGQRPIVPQIRQSQLQKLQMEKEQLRKRQEEILRQEMALRGSLQNQIPNQIQHQQQNSDDVTISQANEMTTVADPFLGQTNSTDMHTRQESADSGLGGSSLEDKTGGMGNTGTNFIPRPDDFLCNVDEMDTQDGGHRQGDFNNMDIGKMGEGDLGGNMEDSDDLVPSLNEDISNDISNELLNDVENVLNNSKVDNLEVNNLLTWL